MCRKNNPRLYLALEVVIGEDHFKGIHDQWISKEKNDPFDSLDDFLNKHSGKHILIFISYDVLANPELRSGIKDFSNWPTIPQLYVNGEFIGGCDICIELYEKGELANILDN